jgi:hypothetical protein
MSSEESEVLSTRAIVPTERFAPMPTPDSWSTGTIPTRRPVESVTMT